MKLLFDFFPVLLFFVTFKLYDDQQAGILAATAVIIVATAVQIGLSWAWRRRVEKMHLVTLVLVVLFGGATLVLQDELFIKWKPTVVNWLFGAAFLASQFVGRKNLVQRMMDHAVELPDPVWTRLNWAWVIYFVLMGLLNLYVVYNFDTETWVNFKLFGLLGCTIVFVVAQGFYLVRHMPSDDADAADAADGKTGGE